MLISFLLWQCIIAIPLSCFMVLLRYGSHRRSFNLILLFVPPSPMKHPFAIILSLLLLSFSAGLAIVIPDPLPKAPEPIDDILRLQILLDTQLFGPGKLDGRPGEFTTKALKRYQLSLIHISEPTRPY